MATLYEALRYTSVVPTGARRTIEDTHLNGNHIPKGTTIFINLYPIHHDNKNWNRPELFKPERFLDADGKLVAADHKNRKMLFPFGAGARVCIGEVFAKTRLFLIIASIAQNFRIEQDEPKVPCHPSTYNISIVLDGSDYLVKMTDRKSGKADS